MKPYSEAIFFRNVCSCRNNFLTAIHNSITSFERQLGINRSNPLGEGLNLLPDHAETMPRDMVQPPL